MSKYDSRRYDEMIVKQQYGDPFEASYGEERNIAPLGLSRAQRKAVAKKAAKEEKEKAKAAKAEAKAAAKSAKAEAKSEEKTNYISINANSPKSMKNRRGRVHGTNNVTNTIAQRIRRNPRMTRTHATNNVTQKKGLKVPSFSTKGMSLNGPLFKNKLHRNTQNVPKEKKNMTFIERKIADMLKRESQEEKNAFARKELEQMVSPSNKEEEEYNKEWKKEQNVALNKHLRSIHASETNGINKELTKSVKRMSIKEKKNNQNSFPYFPGLFEPTKTNPRPRPQPRVRKTENAPKPKPVPNGHKLRPRPQPRVRVKSDTKSENAPKPGPKPVPRGRAVPRGTKKNI